MAISENKKRARSQRSDRGPQANREEVPTAGPRPASARDRSKQQIVLTVENRDRLKQMLTDHGATIDATKAVNRILEFVARLDAISQSVILSRLGVTTLEQAAEHAKLIRSREDRENT